MYLRTSRHTTLKQKLCVNDYIMRQRNFYISKDIKYTIKAITKSRNKLGDFCHSYIITKRLCIMLCGLSRDLIYASLLSLPNLIKVWYNLKPLLSKVFRDNKIIINYPWGSVSSLQNNKKCKTIIPVLSYRREYAFHCIWRMSCPIGWKTPTFTPCQLENCSTIKLFFG